MSDVEALAIEPFIIDRELAKAARRWQSFRRQLREGKGFDLDPFEASREFLGRSTFRALLEVPGDPVAPRLARWVYRLAEQRIDRQWLVAIAQKRTGRALELGHELSHAELVRSALGEPARRHERLTHALQRSEPIHTLVAGLWERRQEVAEALIPESAPRALGYDSAPSEDPSSLAEAWLDASESLLQAPGSSRPCEWWMGGALGDVDAGWPAHLNPSSLTDLFRDTRLLEALELDPGRLPKAIAPASFMRALARLGAAVLVASAPRDQPFCIAHDAYGLQRFRYGALLGTLPLSAAFAMRRLGASRELARRATRAAAMTVLLESRIAALRVLLGEAALRGPGALRDAYSEGVYRCLGIELPDTAAGAFIKLRMDDAQRFCGLFLAIQSSHRLRDAHDEDWFRNPRAIDQLRSEAALPPEIAVPREQLDAALVTTESALRELLG